MSGNPAGIDPSIGASRDFPGICFGLPFVGDTGELTAAPG